MRVLITGASGKLAGFIIRELRDQYQLVLTSRRKPDAEFSDLPWIEGDLNSFSDCQQAVDGIEAIQHLGAQPNPVDHPQLRQQAQENEIPFDATFKTNMLGTYYLMQAAVKTKVKIVVMAGSNCALGHGFRISETPFPIQKLPIDETHPCLPEDSYSFSKRAGEELLASYTRAYGVRTYMTRPAGITPPERRQSMAENVKPATGWNPWLWCWVGSEDVATAHRLVMEASMGKLDRSIPQHDVYFLNAADTSALEPSAELVKKFKPELADQARNIVGHQSFLDCQKLERAVGWKHQTSWRSHLK
jgi:nucleoside-diphosphate-sugar epimerase